MKLGLKYPDKRRAPGHNWKNYDVVSEQEATMIVKEKENFLNKKDWVHIYLFGREGKNKENYFFANLEDFFNREIS